MYDLSFNFVDGSSERQTQNRNLQLLRDKNLEWYGEYEIKTCNMFQGFGRYNFLDTDAAVDLSIEKNEGNIEEYLSKLLVGPEASEAWKKIVALYNEIKQQTDDRRMHITLLQANVEKNETQLDAYKKNAKESDPIKIKLNELIQLVGWVGLTEGAEETKHFTEELTELISLIRQLTDLNIGISALTFDEMDKWYSNNKVIINDVEPKMSEMDLLMSKESNLLLAKQNYQKILIKINILRRYITIGFSKRVKEKNSLTNEIDNFSLLLAGVDYETLKQIQITQETPSLEIFNRNIEIALKEAEQSLKGVSDEYKQFRRTLIETTSLAQELRNIANKLIEKNLTPDQCPLCHTKFKSGNLLKNINIDIDKNLEIHAQLLLENIQQLENKRKELNELKIASEWLINFSALAGLSIKQKVNEIIEKVNEISLKFREAQNALIKMNSELEELDRQGFSETNLEKVVEQIEELGLQQIQISNKSLDELIEQTAEKENRNLAELVKTQNRKNDLQEFIDSQLGLQAFDIKIVKGKIRDTKDLMKNFDYIKANIKSHINLFPLPQRMDLTELTIILQTIRDIACDLQAAIEREKQNTLNFGGTVQQIEENKKSIMGESTNLSRLENAKRILLEIIEKHSLSKAMESSLSLNRNMIENIYMRIHSPVEFQGIGSSMKKLKRKIDAREVGLNQRRTGQEASFCARNFPAHNSQITKSSANNVNR